MRDQSGKWQVVAFVNNVFDKQYFPSLVNTAGNFGNKIATQVIVPRDYRRFGGEPYTSAFGASNGPAKDGYRSAVVRLDVGTGRVRSAAEPSWVFGEPVLVSRPGKVGIALLKRYPSYQAFAGQAATDSASTGPQGDPASSRTPRELLDDSYRALRKATAEDLLSRLRMCSPGFFEKAVLKSPSFSQPSPIRTKSRVQPAGGGGGTGKRSAISSPAFMIT